MPLCPVPCPNPRAWYGGAFLTYPCQVCLEQLFSSFASSSTSSESFNYHCPPCPLRVWCACDLPLSAYLSRGCHRLPEPEHHHIPLVTKSKRLGAGPRISSNLARWPFFILSCIRIVPICIRHRPTTHSLHSRTCTIKLFLNRYIVFQYSVA